jgi:RNA polymerase sigma-70 factor (ECF subfamily)
MNPPGPAVTYTPKESADAGQADDRELMARMGAGDEAALAALYDRWSRPVHALVSHIVRDADDADDVLEETFWQAWRQASRYDAGRGAVGTWLLTIARSRALDQLRSRTRLREDTLTPVPGKERVEMVEATGDDPAGRVEALERRTRVAAALTTLPPEQRQVLELAYFGGLSQTEIAEQTGQPLGTVKTRTRLAAEKLRDALAAFRPERPRGAVSP